MKIGFDAKRAFHNITGLGNYSRTVIEGLATFYPQHEYILFNPKPSEIYQPSHNSVREVKPAGLVDKNLSSLWRSSRIKADLQKCGIDLYHGLSNEIPVGIKKTNIPAVVTIHDLIFEKFPEQFNKIDVGIYKRKYRYACEQAERVIAISNQTKLDIIEYYKIDEQKIDVCYQSCHSAFGKKLSEAALEAIRKKLHLPSRYILYVGSIIERKNLLNVCKALQGLDDVQLVVVGKGKKYKAEVQEYIRENKLAQRILFLSDSHQADLKDIDTLAAVYQSASAFIYPSFYEGFGIPILEALWSGVPVITSNTSCLPEVGGNAAYYVDPSRVDDIQSAISNVLHNSKLREKMIERGYVHAQGFDLATCTKALMDIYKKLVDQ